MKFWGKFFILAFSALILNGCGGGGGNGDNQPVVNHSITGAAIKGPLIRAAISIYTLDISRADLKGNLVVSGATSDQASFAGLVLTEPLNEAYLLEATVQDSTIDITTLTKPYFSHLRAVVSADAIRNNSPLYATPQTTMALIIAKNNLTTNSSVSDFLQETLAAQTVLAAEFGFGINGSLDIFHSPALAVDDENFSLMNIATYRTAIEAASSLIFHCTRGTGIAPDQLLEDISFDLSDGVLDGLLNGETVASYAQIPNLLDLLTGSAILSLEIPGTDKDGNSDTTDPYSVEEVELLIAAETATTRTTRNVSPFEMQTINFRPSPLSIDTDGEGIPDKTDPDDDNDGIDDINDAFPLDAGEHLDLDGDGIGDNSDAYPNDAACSIASDGNGQLCYLTWMASQTISQTIASSTGEIAFYTSGWDSILRYDTASNRLLDPIPATCGGSSVTRIVYSDSHRRLYLGYGDGSIRFARFGETVITDFDATAQSVNGLAAVGNFVLAQDNDGAWVTHYIFGRDGVLTDSKDWNHYSRAYAWDPVMSKVYFFRDGTSPNDLHYETIDQATGTIPAQGETPYHGAYSIQPPIRVSLDGQHVLLGSGDIYESSQLNWETSIGQAISDAYWMADNTLVTINNQAGNTYLEHRDSSMNIVEYKVFSGSPVALFLIQGKGIVVTKDGAHIRFHTYSPSNDSDNDGIANSLDAFPMDIAAAIDSDLDGFPDAWNQGYSATDSTTGLSLDAYPNDSACSLVAHGDGTICDYGSTIPTYIPDQTEYDQNGIIYLLSQDNGRVYRWSIADNHYINPLVVELNKGLVSISPRVMAYSENHRRLYLGYATGEIYYIDLDGEKTLTHFANLAMLVGGLASAGEHILAQDNSGAWEAHYIFDRNGILTDYQDWNNYSRSYAWNSALSRIYFFDDGTSPNDLHFEEINSASGLITAEGETPYHGDYPIAPPIRLSPDSNQVLLGSGHVYDALSLNWTGSIGQTVSDGFWTNNKIVTLSPLSTYSQVKLWDRTSFLNLSTLQYPGTPIAIVPNEIDAVAIISNGSSLTFQNVLLGDHDNDGIPGWWEQQYGLDDNDVSDASLDPDSDGLNSLAEFDAGTSPVAPDSDADTINDGDELNTYKTNPLLADSDADGINDGQEINLYGTNPLNADSDSDGLNDADEIQQFSTNPLNNDSDSDGMTDAWEIANGLNPLVNEAQSDTDGDGLSNLDELSYNTDPNLQDSDGDGLLDGEEVDTYASDPTLYDTDNDHLPDGWEVSNGFDPLDSLDASRDTDGDSFSNEEEYFLSSDPNDLNSLPIVQAWTTYQGNAAHNGFVPLAINPQDLSERWTINLGGSLNPVVAANGHVFVSLNGYYANEQWIKAINAVTGTTTWENSYGRINSINPPAYQDGKVYFQTGGHSDSFLRALDANTGSLHFKSAFNNQWSRYFAPTPFGDGIHIAGGSYGGSYSFDTTTGAQNWFVDLNLYDKWTPAVDDNYVYAYTGNYSPKLDVINRANGTVEFTIPDPDFVWNGWSMNVAPVIGHDNNIIASHDTRLLSFDLVNRNIKWVVNGNFSGQPSLAVGEIYALKDGTLSAYDEYSGAWHWSWEPAGGELLTSNIVITRNLAFVGGGSTTYAVDLETLQTVWSYPAAGQLALSDEGALYIAGSSGQLTAINVSGDTDGDGMPDWWEDGYNLDSSDAADAILDADADGLTNLEEFQNQTTPNLADSDSDTIPDGDEVNVYVTDPNLSDTDNDGLDDGIEINTYGTDPLNVDSDGDTFSDSDEVNLYSTDPNDAGSYPPSVTSMMESFEDSALPAGWEPITGQASDWVLDSSFSSDGSQSINSGAISHNQQSGIEYRNIFAAGTLSYGAKVDAESCCDKLRFYVDGTLVHTISAGGWQQLSTALDSGEHLLQWVYAKDGSVNTGLDAAWIDAVNFIGN